MTEDRHFKWSSDNVSQASDIRGHSSIKHHSVFKAALLVYNFYMVVIQNTSNLSLNPETVCIELVEVNLMSCYLSSYTLHQYISLKTILASALHMMPQEFGMICLMMYAQPNLSLHFGRS